MFTAFKGLFSSKKFWTAILGGAVTAGMANAGVSADIQHWVMGLVATLIGAQGLADFGKNGK